MPKTKHKNYGEKKSPLTISLTPTAKKILGTKAKDLNLSLSEVVEQMAREPHQDLYVLEETRLLGESCAG